MPLTPRNLLINPDASKKRLAAVRPGFSLLETTIAISLLGIGLIMVAAIFPVALTQHRDSVLLAMSTELTTKADALLRGKVNPNLLWSNSNLLAQGLDSPWYLMPFDNLSANGGWDSRVSLGQATSYANAVNDAPVGANELQLIGADALSDRFTPANDDVFQRAAYRLAWNGFYRRLANGTVCFTAAISKQQRNQIFAMQDASVANFPANPTAAMSNLIVDGRRLPVPWRVRVFRNAAGRLYNNGNAEGLAELAPRGSKIMIQGTTVSAGPTGLAVPAGRIFTVSDIYNPRTIEVREDTSDLPDDTQGSFDIWLFPPAVIGADPGNVQFGQEAPVIDWKVLL